MISLCQMTVIDDKNRNIDKALKMIEVAKKQGSQLVILPEMFNCPYDNKCFQQYSESLQDGLTVKAISEAARESGIYIAAGSIPERDGEALYNTCCFFDRKGRVIARHRKLHLFDIDIPDKITFRESDNFSAGNTLTVVDTELCRIGLAICYDIRFPDVMIAMGINESKLIIIPAAFNMTTGPAHWELLIRSRAIDSQAYVAAVSPARNTNASYVAYGNSMVADPWGRVIIQADEKEQIIHTEINVDLADRIRQELPILKHRRNEVYTKGVVIFDK